ncbi:Hydrolyzes glycerol-phospholipids at the terminal phosphodiesteric bond [Stylosanthes scabra]|uniref:Hydrolyzes glycerol-phospholipids at the terminal phosphodiesteric bond n=1 Tax=Stylosanthes scabra TaxID=79078 RepID=A0ABU6XM95_9FABA|nr:Hydrolyzes glycerol-phospholipids at the terminal phosphodiesteric bond [Stylosanthes scabra]
MDGGRDSEIAMGAYQPHHLATGQGGAKGQIHGFRMSLWYEHLGKHDDVFLNPEGEECIKKVNQLAGEYFNEYDRKSPIQDLSGHLLHYPIKISAEGTVTNIENLELFPHTNAHILGNNAPDIVTDFTPDRVFDLNKSHVSCIELYIEFEQVAVKAVEDVSHVDLERQAVLEEMYSGSEDEFEAIYEAPDEEEGNEGVDVAVQNVTNQLASQHPFGVPSCMRQLDDVDINAPEFPEYVNIVVAALENGEFMMGMEYIFRKAVVAAIRKYIISRGVDYTVWESKPQIIYAKCKLYENGCDWLPSGPPHQNPKSFEVR